MSIKWDAPKDPEEVKDYELDWAPLVVGGDALVSVDWSVVSPEDTTLTVDSSSIDGLVSTVWFSGGELGTGGAAVKAEVLGHAVTTGGREYEQTMILTIKKK